jgi:glycerate dehydrogenase
VANRCLVLRFECSGFDRGRVKVDRRLLEMVKSSACLINTTRGQLINEKDLISCLEKGKLAGAALDVLSKEPPSIDDPILRAPNCIVTPHMAWATLPARRRIMQTTIANIEAYLAGNLINAVGLERNK